VSQTDARPQRLEAVVRGQVQGVGFRWFVTRQAALLGLTGWVANRPDGSVEVVAEGPADALDGLQGLLAGGPAGARVERVETSRGAAQGDLERFQVRSGFHTGD
jgi:acylphosphatase